MIDSMKTLLSVADYAKQIGCGSGDCAADLEAAEGYLNPLANILAQRRFHDLSSDATRRLYRYKVPKLSGDGACSLSDGPEDTFDLRLYEGIAGREFATLRGDRATERLWMLSHICQALHRKTGADWTGIYRRHEGTPPVLVKEAYRGRASRALFPLTKKFARGSNNSTVGLGGKAVLVNSVQQHVEKGNPYYACDTQVQSEFCLPIVRDGRTAGIMDLESFEEGHFNAERRGMAVAASYLLATEPRLF